MASENTTKFYKYVLSRFEDKIDIHDPIATLKVLQMDDAKGKKLSASYIKGIICAIVWKLKHENPEDPALFNYKLIISHLRSTSEAKERSNKKTGREQKQIPKWEDVIKIRDECLAHDKFKEYVLLCLYTMMPPRRITDYLKMKLCVKPQETDNPRFNYYYANQKQFVFNVYKTSAHYGQQILDCPEELHKIIMNYAKIAEIEISGSLLGYKTSFQMIYRLKTLVGCSASGLRHSFLTNYYGNFTVSNDELEKLSAQMGHSLTQNLLYRKY